MQKIMFNDRFELTAAVLEGRKTMTRRIRGWDKICLYRMNGNDVEVYISQTRSWWKAKYKSKYKVGGKIAIAQSYKGIYDEYCSNELFSKAEVIECLYVKSGWNNKMFVKADLMPHAIEITDIKAERLQDISDDDCLREGIRRCNLNKKYAFDDKRAYNTPREAFAALIDKVSGKGTWQSNPWCFCYTFKLIK